jgi:hypothetical protein
VVQHADLAGLRIDRAGEFDNGVDRLSGDGDERQTGDGDRDRLTP